MAEANGNGNGKGWAQAIVGIIGAGALSFYASTQALQTQTAELRGSITTEIRALKVQVQGIESWRAETSANRFTRTDSTGLRDELLVRLNELERRQALQNDFFSRRLDAIEGRTGGPRLDGPLNNR